jgi:hypothetical protein
MPFHCFYICLQNMNTDAMLKNNEVSGFSKIGVVFVFKNLVVGKFFTPSVLGNHECVVGQPRGLPLLRG